MRLAQSVLNAKPIKDCTPAELKKVRDIAKLHASRKGRPQLADDFAAFLMEDLVRQGTLRYNLHWRWAQYLRVEGGANLRNMKGLAKARALAKPLPVEKAIHIRDEAPSALDAVAWQDMLKPMEKDVRAVAVLTFKWGFTEREVAEVLGVTWQRVNQIMKKLEALGAKRWFQRKLTGDELIWSDK